MTITEELNYRNMINFCNRQLVYKKNLKKSTLMHSTLEYIQQFYKLVFHKELKKKPQNNPFDVLHVYIFTSTL